MQIRRFNRLFFASALLLTGSAVAVAQPAPAPAPAPDANAAPGAAPAPAAAAQPASQFSVMQTVGDWVVRCAQVTVKSPAPCDMIQVTTNQTTKQRVSQFSIAYVPSRDLYAVQIIVPTGIALARGLIVTGAAPALANAKFNRCERDGCYVEQLSDGNTVNGLQSIGKTTNISVYAYGADKEIKLPVSFTGFPDALDRMKQYARDRAVAAPNQPGAPGAPAAAPAKTPAKRGGRPAAASAAP